MPNPKSARAHRVKPAELADTRPTIPADPPPPAAAGPWPVDDPEDWPPAAWLVISKSPDGRRMRVQAPPDFDEVVDRSDVGFTILRARGAFEHALTNRVFD